MKEVYFDTNIYNHIHKRHHGVTEADIAKLYATVRADKIRILTSTSVIEEVLSALISLERDSFAILKHIRKLAKRKRILKYHPNLLEDDIVAYSRGKKMPSHFMAPPPNFTKIFTDHGPDHMAILRKIAEDTQKQIQSFRDKMDNSYIKHIRPLAEEIKRQKKQQSFEDYWAELSIPFAELLAKKAGVLAECQERGMEGLLEVRSVRLCTLAQLSLGYSNTYQRTTIDRGDSRDMHHAVLASSVNTFVTHDRRFAGILRRMPVDNFEVIDLKTLLSQFQ
jgi:predicted nucleic acid-binding protein